MGLKKKKSTSQLDIEKRPILLCKGFTKNIKTDNAKIAHFKMIYKPK